MRFQRTSKRARNKNQWLKMTFMWPRPLLAAEARAFVTVKKMIDFDLVDDVSSEFAALAVATLCGIRQAVNMYRNVNRTTIDVDGQRFGELVEEVERLKEELALVNQKSAESEQQNEDAEKVGEELAKIRLLFAHISKNVGEMSAKASPKVLRKTRIK